MQEIFTVVTKPNCPFCDQAKALLDKHGLPYQAVNIDVGQPKQEGATYVTREEVLAQYPGARTVPIITRGDFFVGGFSELRQYLPMLLAQAA
jgi:glutaredoxin